MGYVPDLIERLRQRERELRSEQSVIADTLQALGAKQLGRPKRQATATRKPRKTVARSK